MSSRQRMLAALNLEEPDHTPCSFMLFKSLHLACRDYIDFIERQIEMGLDAFVQLPPRPPVVVNDHYNLHGLPISYDPLLEIKEWIGSEDDEAYPIMIKEYHTPEGTLRVEVRQTEDWRWGDHVPFLDDYIIPRSRRFLINRPQDLAALRYLLVPPTEQEINRFKEETEPVVGFARQHDLLIAGGWGVGADLVGWIFGLFNMIYATYEKPEFMHELLNIIKIWNHARMEVVLDAGIDLYIKRAWYENLDFWTPTSYQEFLAPIVRSDAELAHKKGVKFGYIITSNCMPLLETFAECGIDVLIGVDPAEWDLASTKNRIGDKVCLWGGINGHLTVEQKTADAVQHEVRQSLRILAPGGGFILSPVDNVREDTSLAQNNVQVLIDEWRRLTGQHDHT
jgi:hypothetical protein